MFPNTLSISSFTSISPSSSSNLLKFILIVILTFAFSSKFNFSMGFKTPSLYTAIAFVPILRDLEESAKEENIDKSMVIRWFMLEGLREYKRERTARFYKERRVSIAGVAELAGLTVREMVDKGKFLKGLIHFFLRICFCLYQNKKYSLSCFPLQLHDKQHFQKITAKISPRLQFIMKSTICQMLRPDPYIPPLPWGNLYEEPLRYYRA